MTLSRLRLPFFLAFVCALGCVLPAAARAGDLIVQREPGLNAGERADLRADAGVTLERMLPLRIEVVSAPDHREARALDVLRADEGVRHVARDIPVRAAGDQLSQWWLEDPLDRDIDAPEAWDLSAAGLGAVVGVADMRVDAEHPDLAGNIEPGGQDFVNPGDIPCASGLPEGPDDHGTQVAGLIAAERDNGFGIVGAAPLAHVLPLRTINDCGVGSISWVIEAFAYAGAAKIPIVTASFATDPLESPADRDEAAALLSDVVDDYEDTTLYVVAAGNEGNDNDALPVYPCSLPESNVLCAGMSDVTDNAMCRSNVGATSVDLFAPGDRLWTTTRGGPSNGYTSITGTSASAPLVAAAAALLKAQDSSARPAELAGSLIAGVDPMPGMAGRAVSGGRLNAARPLGARVPYPSTHAGTRPWVSCDPDHDGVAGGDDQCPDQAGSEALGGCPDGDADGLRDDADNCPGVANPNQADTDRDGLGDACDRAPRGPDGDGDGKAALDDRCPAQYGVAADGCPPPVVTPGPAGTSAPTVTPAALRIVKFSVRVTPRTCPRGRSCKKAAKATVTLTRAAKVSLELEQRVRRHGRWVWRKVAAKALKASVNVRSATLRGPGGRALKAGSYRVTATVPGAGKATRRLRV